MKKYMVRMKFGGIEMVLADSFQKMDNELAFFRGEEPVAWFNTDELIGWVLIEPEETNEGA